MSWEEKKLARVCVGDIRTGAITYAVETHDDCCVVEREEIGL